MDIDDDAGLKGTRFRTEATSSAHAVQV